MEKTKVPHVLFLPFPAQGHIKPMLRLAELLSHAGFRATFINTDHNYDRLLHNSVISSFHNRFPKFQFISIPDGLPPDHPRCGRLYIRDLFGSSRAVFKPALRELLISLKEEKGPCQLPTCIIADGILCFAIDVAQEFEIPTLSFRTYSAHCLWTYFHLSKLIEEGEIPFQDENLDKLISCIPGLENVLRRRDLPGICRFEKVDDPILQFFVKETSALTRASGLILNTVNEIEAPMITRLGSFFNKIYAIGPLHTLKSRINDSSPSNSSNGILWKEDKKCLTWLDSQPSRSVLFVSFGSVINLTGDQILEFLYGLVNSKKSFLWVIRPDLIVEDATIGHTLMELDKGVMERGLIVSWAPQEEVLSHPAIGGFLTHSGWNSTLESIVAGVPMICWPQIADQPVNSRCVSEVWKMGFDMKDTCDRSTVEKLVRELMDNEREEIMASANKLARLARDSIKEDGSSFINLEKLIQDIKSMSS